ncbi:MAG: response regulator [Bacteroidetes bacterium]|nr:response regulator [Bacteroidota bacterium]MBS1777047.1 response regulator [Bacteroidota bacterium]
MNLDKMYFIVIDDSKLDCFIAEKVIQNTGRSESVRSFAGASEALEYMKALPPDRKTVILVDIQMPLMNGFEFLDAFKNNIPVEKQSNFIINLLSSSINESDQNRAKAYPFVNQFLNKPLSKGALENMISAIA